MLTYADVCSCRMLPYAGSSAIAELEELNSHVKKVLAFSLDFLSVEVNEISSACFGAQTTLSQLSKEQAAVAEEDRAYVAQFVSDMGAFLHTGTHADVC